MPQIMEMHVSEQEEYRKEYQTVCMFVQGESFYQKATFKESSQSSKDDNTSSKFYEGL